MTDNLDANDKVIVNGRKEEPMYVRAEIEKHVNMLRMRTKESGWQDRNADSVKTYILKRRDALVDWSKKSDSNRAEFESLQDGTKQKGYASINLEAWESPEDIVADIAANPWPIEEQTK